MFSKKHYFLKQLFYFLKEKKYSFFEQYGSSFLLLHPDNPDLKEVQKEHSHMFNTLGHQYVPGTKKVFLTNFDFFNLQIIKGKEEFYLEDYYNFFIKFYKNNPEYRSLLNNYIDTPLYLKMPYSFSSKSEIYSYLKYLELPDNASTHYNFIKSLNIIIDSKLLSDKELHYCFTRFLIKHKNSIEHPEAFPIWRDFVFSHINKKPNEINFLSTHFLKFDLIFNNYKEDYVNIKKLSDNNSVVQINVNSLFIYHNIDFLAQPQFSNITKNILKTFLEVLGYSQTMLFSSHLNDNENNNKKSYIGNRNTIIFNLNIFNNDIDILKVVLNKSFEYIKSLNLTDTFLISLHKIDYKNFIPSVISEYNIQKNIDFQSKQAISKKPKI